VSTEPTDETEETKDDAPTEKQFRDARKASKKTERTPEQAREALRKCVRFFYDMQKLRIATAHRTRGDVLPDGEENPTEPPPKGEMSRIELHEIDQEILALRAKQIHTTEKGVMTDIKALLGTMPFYVKVLSDKERFRGLGPTMAAVILSEFDIHRSDTVSKMWAFAGLAPIPAYRCKVTHELLEPTAVAGGLYVYRSRREIAGAQQEPLGPADVYYSGETMRPRRGEKLPYNAWLRTKLIGVLGDSLIKANSPWRKCYDNRKHARVTAGWGKNDGHRHMDAKRYMVKMLLLEIYKEWRKHEGLPVRESYQDGKIGHHDRPKNVA
jgi:hypothetical protein